MPQRDKPVRRNEIASWRVVHSHVVDSQEQQLKQVITEKEPRRADTRGGGWFTLCQLLLCLTVQLHALDREAID